ncbi:signal peptidase I [Enterococcus sp. AZ192]|uniref:signal peptidase I n=1 Tax=unclassified Enterococcus TaxID=2608891 RepID=UPI003D2D4E51
MSEEKRRTRKKNQPNKKVSLSSKKNSNQKKKRNGKKNTQKNRNSQKKNTSKNAKFVASKREYPPKKKSSKRKKRKKLKRFITEIIVTMSVSLLLFFIVSVATFSLPKAQGYSMTPTINDTDRLFVNKWSAIKRFNLVYFKNPQNGEKSIRRIIALPNERVEYKNGELYIDDTLKAERFISTRFDEVTREPITSDFTLDQLLEVGSVPKDKYFVLGDNRAFSTDSRDYGFIDRKDIIGVVKARVFPFYDMRQF